MDEHKEERQKVAKFNDIGSAIQHELARDSSIPPAEAKRGPDLASRFGPVDEPSASAPDVDETVNEDEPEPADAPDEARDDDVVVDGTGTTQGWYWTNQIAITATGLGVPVASGGASA